VTGTADPGAPPSRTRRRTRWRTRLAGLRVDLAPLRTSRDLWRYDSRIDEHATRERETRAARAAAAEV
jgi:hypothetical protein